MKSGNYVLGYSFASSQDLTSSFCPGNHHWRLSIFKRVTVPADIEHALLWE